MTDGPSSVSLMDGSRNVSLFSSSSLLSSLSLSTPSSSSVLPSLLSLFSLPSSCHESNKTTSSQGQRIVSNSSTQRETATLAPAISLGWTESLTTAQSTAHSAVNLPAVTQQSKTTALLVLTSKTSIQKSNKGTPHLFYSSADEIHGESGTHIRDLNTNMIKIPAN